MLTLLRPSLALLICLALGGFSLAADEAKERANVLAKPSRELLASLKNAQQSASKEHYAEAVVELRKILEPTAGDGFLPSDSPYGSQPTIKREAIRLLDAFPPAGRQLFDMQMAGEVERNLNEAISHGDTQAIAQIARCHFPSPIAVEAVLLLAYDAMDRGQPWECLAWLRFLEMSSAAAKAHEVESQLLKTACYLTLGEPLRARAALDKLGSIRPPTTFHLGDEAHSTVETSEKILKSFGGAEKDRPKTAVLAEYGYWPIFRGDTNRNALAAWSGTLGERRWKVGTLDKQAAYQFSNWRRTNEDEVLFPCLHPLVLGDVLLSRSPSRLSAFDLRTGRLLWENPPHNKVKETKPAAGDPEAELWQRFWDDAPYGQLSSNGNEVFLLDGLDIAQAGEAAPRMIAIGKQVQVLGPKIIRPYNRLLALSLRQQGKTAWSVGGEDGEGEPQLAGYFFLGTPLPYNRQLFVLAEKEGVIRLCVLNAASGKLDWSLPLAQVETTVLDDPVRRLAGASPSFSEGILICPTSDGAVAAVDPATHSLLWGFQYPLAATLADRNPMGVVLPNGKMLPLKRSGINRTVRDAAAVMASGRTFLLPVEADQLFCLNSANGELLWSCPREEMQYIAGVTADKIVLAGHRGLYSRNVQTGKAAWPNECIELPGKSQIIGRGFLVGDYYYLPSTLNEVVKFDLRAGRIAERSHTKYPLGNLTAVSNLLISHTGDSIQVYGPQ
jgi:outer membrane protein assembly factor BamB